MSPIIIFNTVAGEGENHSFTQDDVSVELQGWF